MSITAATPNITTAPSTAETHEVAGTLRQWADSPDRRVRHRTLSGILAGIAAGEPVDLTAAAAGISPEEVRSIAVRVGRWLALTRTARTSRTEGTSPERLAAAGYGPARTAQAAARAATIAGEHPTIARFLTSAYPRTLRVVSFTEVSACVTLDRHRLLGRLTEGQPMRPPAAAAWLAALGLLSDAVAEAADGVAQIGGAAPGEAQALVDRLDWAYAAELQPLRRAINIMGVRDGGHAVAARLATTARHLAGRAPSHPGDLSDAQVLRLARRHGLPTEGQDTAGLRTRIIAVAGEADIDRLVPECLRADIAGAADDYLAVLAARAEGNPDWDERLLALAARLGSGL